ncbi:MAG: 2-thiouracil desulfurase family protein [Desulfurococcaceae archaeon]|nr:2-thiouracil desulfurase family protein [Sulfolobales archaeon]MDW8170804.1 2-thiouracil desulfurase family protein [Desulfurococcaceae archaeon]
MSLRNARGGRVIIVAHCLLNQNSRVFGAAKQTALVKEVVELAYSKEVGLLQMPCPELLYAGYRRFWSVKEQCDNPNYRRFCRKLSKQLADYIEEYLKNHVKVVGIVGIAGSPSCGVLTTASSSEWMGDPGKASSSTRVQGRGVFINELVKELEARGIKLELVEYDYRDFSKSLELLSKLLDKYLEV